MDLSPVLPVSAGCASAQEAPVCVAARCFWVALEPRWAAEIPVISSVQGVQTRRSEKVVGCKQRCMVEGERGHEIVTLA